MLTRRCAIQVGPAPLVLARPKYRDAASVGRAQRRCCAILVRLVDVGRRERDRQLPHPGEEERKTSCAFVCLCLLPSLRCLSAIALTGASATEQAFVEAEAIAKQLLSMAEQFATPPPADLVSRRVILPCNEECTAFAEERARQARNLALMSSLGLEDKDIGGQIEDEGPTYSEFAIEHVSGFEGRWEYFEAAAAWLMPLAFDFQSRRNHILCCFMRSKAR